MTSSGWSEVALGDVADVSWGNTSTTKKAYVDAGFRAYSASGPDGFVDWAEHHDSGVVLSAIGAQCGKTWWAEGSWTCIKNTIWFRSRSGEVESRFLFYATADPGIWPKRGAAQPFISQGDARALRLRLPSLSVQRRVIGVLSAIDDLIENNRRRIEILEEIARLVYREWFVHFRFPGHEDGELVDFNLGSVPKGWEPGMFGDLVEVSREAADPDEIKPGEPLVGLEHLPRRSTTLHDWDCTDDVGSRKSVFVKGDILFGKIRPYFHKVALAPINGYCSTDAIVFRPEPERRWQALAVASSDEFVAHAVQTSNGTKMPRANTDLLLQYPVPIPRPEVGEVFEAVAGPMNLLCENLSVQIRLLREARDVLLPRLISGELDVSDLDLGLEPVA